MGRWLLARLGQAMLAAWGIASLVFIVSRLLPGGPEQAAFAEAGDLGRPAAGAAMPATQQAARLAVRQRLGLAEPVFYVTRTPGPAPRWQWHGLRNQYHRWLTQLAHGNLGTSYRDGQPVATLLANALAYTLPLTALAALVATILAVLLALYLARVPAGFAPAALQLVLSAWQVVPLFLIALSLLLLFANPDVLNLLPAADQPPATAATLPRLGYWLARAALPLLGLVIAVLPGLTLPLAAALRTEAQAGYALTARAKGLTQGLMLRWHSLPNAALPLLPIFTDLLPNLVAGTVVVEVLFALPGSGRLLAEAAAAHDYPVVVAGVLLVASARLLGLVLADVIYFLGDPRLRSAA